jgi:uncharacterized protein YndB with AHSA1/START domain/DNA-binding transcriptional ArsR family regulator
VVNRAEELDRAFAALSHPVRRRIVERLARGPATVAQAAAGTGVSKPAISRHLRVLEDAEVIVRVIEGRQHRLSLNGGPLNGASGWLEHQRELWERKFDVVEDYLRGKEAAMTAPELRLERTFDAPREAVFEAWTSPEVMRRWWAAGPDWDTPLAEVDLRPGGRIRVSMSDPGGGDVYTFSGEYLEVSPPERLVFSSTWEGPNPGAGGRTTTVTVEFQDEGDRTRVILTHAGLPSDESRQSHAGGWNACLDNLERRVISQRVRR